MLSLPSQSESSALPLIRTGSDGRLRFDPQHRLTLLADFKAGGMSAMAFARLHGVKYPTFMSWIAKRRRQETAPADGVPGFAEVVFGASPSGGRNDGLRITLPCGSVLEICSRAALPLAAELLNSLRRTC